MQHHADLAGAILAEVGYGADTVKAVSRLLRKEGLKRDPEVQTLEDVVCLVFLEHYFDEFAEEHEEDKLVDILARTWVKMSERGRSAALELPLSGRARRLVGRALGAEPSGERP
jgi:CRP-like cAMP-binding protein